MKTRVKVLKMADGSVKYQPEFKWFCFWFSFKSYSESPIRFNAMDEATEYLLEQIAREKKHTVVATTYFYGP